MSHGAAKTPTNVSHRREQKEDGEDSFGQLRGFLVFLLRPQACIHRDERGGENALAEKVLQEVRNAERAAECIRSGGVAKIMSEHPVAYQPNKPAEQNAGADSECG